MSYPWWYVPCLTSPMIIALISVLHVLISQYAVGGGILLARENQFALNNGDSEYRKYLKRHARFFLLLTVVLGAVTGVGIWWTIGLASPLATELLIRTFVFGWGIEWVFFILEITALFGFYYFWDSLPKGTHIIMGWIYAGAAWISLVLITGITAFMLNSRGLLGNWQETGSFWHAFFNKQFIPQTVLRTGASLVFATFYVYLHAVWTQTDNKTREKTVRRMFLPSVIGISLIIVGMIGWFIFLPKSSMMMMERSAVMNIFSGVFVATLAAVILLFIVGPVLAPGSMSRSTATALFLFGIAAIGTSEFIREGVRKPFIIDRVVYGNQIRVEDAGRIARNGLLPSGEWTRLYLSVLQEKYPNLRIAPVRNYALSEENQNLPFDTAVQNAQWTSEHQSSEVSPIAEVAQASPISPQNYQSDDIASPESLKAIIPLPDEDAARPGEEDLLRVSQEDQIALGKMIFLYHCNDCHAASHGYSAAGPLLTGKSEAEIIGFLRHLNRPHYYMPPWVGNDVEAVLLARYLLSIRPAMPSNLTGEETVPPESATEALPPANPVH